jgi:SAM-dependent MidA family methyltransferase
VNLRQKIAQEIREHGPMPFSRYMELCLYHPELGYYSRNAEQFGKAGDFYTSSDVHAVFGRLLTRQFEEIWRMLGSPDRIELLELGPGRGLFAQDVLDWSGKKFPDFFAALHYSLAEQSPALRQRLQATLDRYFQIRKVSLTVTSIFDHANATGKGTTSVVPNAISMARVLAPEVPIIIFANEFFDALPVEIVSPQGQLHVSEKDGRLFESWHPPSPAALEFIDRYSVHPEGAERAEASLIAQCYMSQIAAAIERGVIVAIDYGYTRQEQLAGRYRGTIAAYRQHSVSTNPYEAPGEQDVTAHVNFTALAAAAEAKGVQAQPLVTQSQFLMGIGEHNQFADVFEDTQLPQERAKVALQLKHLVTPAGIGETFHVLIASKGIEPEKVAALSGLMFGKISREPHKTKSNQ